MTEIGRPHSKKQEQTALGSLIHRPAPHDTACEQQVLGTLLMCHEFYNEVSDFLKPEHFVINAHASLYEAIVGQRAAGKVADPVTLSHWARGCGYLAELGGEKYLVELSTLGGMPLTAGEYARYLVELYQRRQLLDFADEVQGAAYYPDTSDNPVEQIAAFEKRLSKIAETLPSTASVVHIASLVDQAFVEAEKRIDELESGIQSRVFTGLADLDAIIGGFVPGELAVVAARPSMGKTTLAMNIAYNVAVAHTTRGDRPAGVAVFSLETDGVSLAEQNLQVRATGIPGAVLSAGDKLTREELAVANAKADAVRKLPIYIDSTPVLSVPNIRLRLRQMARKTPICIAIIDYLQLISSDQPAENDVRELGNMTRGLKQIARELQIPVVILAQLNRSVEATESKRPSKHHLRGSGRIEEDADKILFPFRAAYYLQRDEPPADGSTVRWEWERKFKEVEHLMEIIVEKNRRGKVGVARIYFDGPTAYCGNLARPDAYGGGL